MSQFDTHTGHRHISKGRSLCAVVHPDISAAAFRRMAKGGTKRSRGTSRTAGAALDEAIGLAQAIDLDVVHTRIIRVQKIRPATLIGGGAVDELAQTFAAHEIDVVVVNGALTPIQQRNLEKAWDRKVIDRTGLILEIFGARARTREGRLQVELAALIYQRSRLVRSWTHLERQRGGLGFVGGPGETQIEADRRMIGDRITRLRKELDEVKRTRDLHRKARRRVPYPIVALVGYTNSGKSTLFNSITKADVMAKDQLFATLDPTMRAVELPSGRNIILSDTVGFVSDLPHELVVAFHATLEEVTEAQIILHVRDIAHGDTDVQKSDVETVMAEMGVDVNSDRKDVIEVLNKADLLADDEIDALTHRTARKDNGPVVTSALTGQGIDALLTRLDVHLGAQRQTVRLSVPVHDGALLSWLYQKGEVTERTDEDETIHITVRLDEADVARLEQKRAQTR